MHLLCLKAPSVLLAATIWFVAGVVASTPLDAFAADASTWNMTVGFCTVISLSAVDMHRLTRHSCHMSSILAVGLPTRTGTEKSITSLSGSKSRHTKKPTYYTNVAPR